MAKDPIEQHLIDRNRRDTLRRAGIVRGIKDPALAAKKLKDYDQAVHARGHCNQILSLDDFDSLPGDSPLRDIGRIPTYQEAYAAHGKEW